MKKINAWTLEEALEFAVFGNDEITSFISQYVTNPLSEEDSTIFNELFSKYIFPRFYDWLCVKEEVDLFSENIYPYAKNKDLAIRFLSIFINTKERYKTIRNIYTSNINNLMAKVESTSKIKFNDTPQNAGEFDGDNHNTHVTTTTNNSDIDSPIKRIDEISVKLRNIMLEWSNEFIGMFWR